MTPATALAAAGFVATAVAFGPARMGFGLFLPTLRPTFGLTTAQAGMIASLAFSAFLIALPLTAWLSRHVGQRLPVMAGALAASLGFGLVATAASTTALAAGIILAGASAGFCWAPFNDAAERVVPEAARPGILSAVSTGTAVGVCAAGALFLVITAGAFDWRLPWAGFALIGLGAAGLAVPGLPSGPTPARPIPVSPLRFFRKAAVPLYVAAIAFGACNAAYLSFAADHVVAAGGLPGLADQAAAAVIFVSYGLFGLVGLITGRLEAGFGLYPLVAGIFLAFAASLALVAVRPGLWAVVVLSAALHGAAVMTISAILSFWSLRLFPGRGSDGFTAALIGVAAASVLGAALAGAIAQAIDVATALLVAAAAPASAAIYFITQAVQQSRMKRRRL